MSTRPVPASSRPGASSIRPSAWAQRGTVLLAGGIIFLVLAGALSGRSWPIVMTRLVSDGLLLMAWLAAAGGWGTLLPLPRLQDGDSDRCLRAVTRIAAGLGSISLLVLGCGLAGLTHRIIGSAVVILGIALLLLRIRKVESGDVLGWLRAPVGAGWLWLSVVPVLAMATVAAFVIPGLLWGDEPHGYDVVEYHLQLPREWFELGRVVPLKHNVFSFFPLGMEMHYLLAMQLKGSPWAGMYLAQLMHVAMTALAVVAVYAIARAGQARALAAILAAVAAASVPWMMLLAPVAYNEGALLLFATLAVGWTMRAMNPADSLEWRPWLIAGVMAGFACGVKLTAVPLVLLIVPIVGATVAIARGGHARRPITGAAIFLGVGAVAFSPWLIRNLAWTGNPVFPEAQGIFGRAHFSETQSRRWELAHSPTEAQRPLPARVSAVRNQIGRDWRFGWLALPLGLVALAMSWRRREAWMLMALLVAWLVFWIGFTHLQGRFYVIAIPVAALAVGLVRGRWQIFRVGFEVLIRGKQRSVRVDEHLPVIDMAAVRLVHPIAAVGAGVAVLVIINLWQTSMIFQQRVAPLCDAGVLGVEDLTELLPQELRDALVLKPDAEVALVGDARAFLYPIPMSRLRYRTVFDVDVSAGESLVDAWLGEGNDDAIVVVDPAELERFSRTYFGIPPLPPELSGRDRPFVLAND